MIRIRILILSAKKRVGVGKRGLSVGVGGWGGGGGDGHGLNCLDLCNKNSTLYQLVTFARVVCSREACNGFVEFVPGLNREHTGRFRSADVIPKLVCFEISSTSIRIAYSNIDHEMIKFIFI